MLLCIGCATDTTTDIEVLPQSEKEIYISLESSPLSRIELNEYCYGLTSVFCKGTTPPTANLEDIVLGMPLTTTPQTVRFMSLPSR